MKRRRARESGWDEGGGEGGRVSGVREEVRENGYVGERGRKGMINKCNYI